MPTVRSPELETKSPLNPYEDVSQPPPPPPPSTHDRLSPDTQHPVDYESAARLTAPPPPSAHERRFSPAGPRPRSPRHGKSPTLTPQHRRPMHNSPSLTPEEHRRPVKNPSMTPQERQRKLLENYRQNDQLQAQERQVAAKAARAEGHHGRSPLHPEAPRHQTSAPPSRKKKPIDYSHQRSLQLQNDVGYQNSFFDSPMNTIVERNGQHEHRMFQHPMHAGHDENTGSYHDTTGSHHDNIHLPTGSPDSTRSSIPDTLPGTPSAHFDDELKKRRNSGYAPAQTPYRSRNRSSKMHETKWYWRYLTGTPAVILGAIIGILLGIFLPRGDEMSVAADWISLPGELFIRALKSLVVPMVFASLSVGMADILSVGKASKIGWKTLAMYVLTSILASVQSIFWATVFRSSFSRNTDLGVDTDPIVGFKCDNGNFMEMNNDDTLTCTATEASNSTRFLLDDVNAVLNLKGESYTAITISDQIMGLLRKMIPVNITAAFAEGNLLSVVLFALCFGIALAKSHRSTTHGRNNLLDFLRQVNNIFLVLIKWIINITPIAVISLIAGSIMKNSDTEILRDLGYLVAAIVSCVLGHVLVVMPMMFFFFTRTNPYGYMKQMIPAQIFAFGSASSMVTVPVTMRCVDATKQVSRSLSRFIVSLGATINMDGAAIYYPIGVVFLAETSGQGPIIGNVQLILLLIVSTIASIGGAPVPNAGLVMIITVWNTTVSNVFPKQAFALLVAIDWLIDRFRTVTNVTGDTFIARIVADLVDETYLNEQDMSENLY